MKKFIAMLASIAIMLTVISNVVALEYNKIIPGYSVSENVDFLNSDAANQVRFTYQTDEDLEKVELVGGFAFYTEEAAQTYLDGGSVGTIPPVSPENFKQGMFTTGHLVSPGGYVTIEMNEVEKGLWVIDVPLPNGQYYYRFNLYESGATSAKQIVDPANKPFANGENDSGWSLLYVGDNKDCLEYQEYIFPRNDNEKGSVEYVSYEAIDGTKQPMGVYLPKGYDSRNTYKTLYLSHGSGGNEVEWMEIGSAANIMDNLIAEGFVEDTIIITLDHTYFNLGNSEPGRGFEKIKDNLMDYVIPYVESNYNVSLNAADRAFAGLSGGSRLATFLYQENAGDFGYFGMFSHTLRGVDVENIENNEFPTLMLGYGNLDPFGKQYYPDFTNRLRAAGIDYDLYDVNGGHDWGAWRSLLTIFVKDYLWKDSDKPANPDGTIVPNGTQKAYIVPEDWGPVVTKTVIELDQQIMKSSINDEANEFMVIETKPTLLPTWQIEICDATRNILSAYTSDKDGNKIDEDSNYITIEMAISPTMTGEGAAFVYNGYNEWCDPYQLDIKLNGILKTADGKNVTALNVIKDIDLAGDDRICLEINMFESDTFKASDGVTLPYASYKPNTDDKNNALVVWLHGAGEGGTNPEVAYLGNKVTALISDEFQNNFGGAYILVPQCPEGYGWPVDQDGNYTNGKTPSRWRDSLFELIDTYVKNNSDIDTNRIIIGGCSNGGNMVYDLVLSHMGYFAAAFPMCHEFDIETVTTKQLDYLKDFPVWSTYTLGDSSSFVGSIPIVEKMKEIGANNFHYSEFENASDVTGRFFGDPENPQILDTTNTSTIPLQYDGHWAWTLFFNNQCIDRDGINAWQWLAKQTKAIEEQPTSPEIPEESNENTSPNQDDRNIKNNVLTGDSANFILYALIAGIALTTTIKFKKFN